MNLVLTGLATFSGAFLLFVESSAPVVRYVSPERKLVVILLSAVFFLGVVSYSAKRLLGGRGDRW